MTTEKIEDRPSSFIDAFAIIFTAAINKMMQRILLSSQRRAAAATASASAAASRPSASALSTTTTRSFSAAVLEDDPNDGRFSIQGTFREGRATYLDMSATTPMDPRVLDKMMPFMVSGYNNHAVFKFGTSLVHIFAIYSFDIFC